MMCETDYLGLWSFKVYKDQLEFLKYNLIFLSYCLCGLVVRVPGCRSRSPGFDSRRYQIFWQIVSLERGPLSLVRITEELPEWKSSGSEINGDPLRWPRDTLYPQKLAVTLPTSGDHSIGVVRLRTKATEFSFIWFFRSHKSKKAGEHKFSQHNEHLLLVSPSDNAIQNTSAKHSACYFRVGKAYV
jgi:hypothetical protein